MDTSVLVAGLVEQHEFHQVARPHVEAAAGAPIVGIVLAETWSALRRGPWNLSADLVGRALAPWAREELVLSTPPAAYVRTLRTGGALQLGGSVHDYLIVLTASTHGLPLVTLDRRQAAFAEDVPGSSVTLLLPDA